MKGLSREPVTYICEDERGLPKEEQTVFHLIPKNPQMANETVRRYARASVEGRNGQREYDDRALTAADIEEFQALCVKVENFVFSEKYLMAHPQVKQMVGETGYIAVIEEAGMLADVMTELSPDTLQEIFQVVSNPVKLSRGAKKN
jgi:hypothetical protein